MELLITVWVVAFAVAFLFELATMPRWTWKREKKPHWRRRSRARHHRKRRIRLGYVWQRLRGNRFPRKAKRR
jgi:hypothetical protein